MPRWSPFEPYFWSLVVKSDGCWTWIGSLDGKGYGRIWRDGRRQAAHRVSYELSKEPIPEGLNVCHHCDNKPCVRPSHLFIGTQVDNMQDWTKKGRNRLVNDPSLWKYGDHHWTRSQTKKAKTELKRISNSRKQEWATGKRIVIRNAKGQIMGSRMIGK